jgi:carbonic anhydrase
MSRRQLLRTGLAIGGACAAATVLGIDTSDALGVGATQAAPDGLATDAGQLASSATAPHWEYEGPLGPDHWASIDPSYALCGSGTRQSPIDLVRAARGGLRPIQIKYRPSRLTVVNNGHTIQANAPAGSTIVLDGTQYTLKQFHFHLPSEHTVAGHHYAMEIHFVHEDASKNLAVIGGLMKQRAGTNHALDPIWRNLPRNKGDMVMVSAPFHFVSLFPGNRNFYRYQGSLTTPPCSQGVTWSVFTTPIPVSKGQVQAYRNIFKVSNRPVQPIKGRNLKVSNILSLP